MVADGVGLDDVGVHVLVGLLEVGEDGLGEGVVALVGEVEGLLAEGGLGDGVEGVFDDGVALQVLCEMQLVY